MTTSTLRNSDVLWMYAKWNSPDVPGWSGFVENLTKEKAHTKSRIIFLPFIHQPASNYNILYTTLLYILEDGKKHGHTTCIVTLDQPLYFKAREIIATLIENAELFKLIRLGGFHLLMSFLGGIGYIMAGSGPKEVLSIIFAPNSVDKILLGHAYSRAVRAHTLLQVALSQIILKEITFDEEQKKKFELYLENLHEKSFEDVETSSDIKELKLLFNEKIAEIKKGGPPHNCGCNTLR